MRGLMVMVAVGDRKIIESQIAALRLGPIGFRVPGGESAETVSRKSAAVR